MIRKPPPLSTPIKPNLPNFSANNYRIKFSTIRVVFNITLKIPLIGNIIKYVYRLLTNRNIFEYTYNAQNALNNKCFAISQNSNIRVYRASFQDIIKNCSPTVITFSTNENGEFKTGLSSDVLSSYDTKEDPPFTKTFPNLTNSNYIDESGAVGNIRQFKPSNFLRNKGIEQLYGLILKENKDKDAPLIKKQLQKTIVSLFHSAIKHKETNKIVINLPLQSCGIDIADTGKYLDNKNSIKQIIATADAYMRYQQSIDPDVKITFNMFISPEEEYGNNQDFNEMLNDINQDYISNEAQQAKETNEFLQNDIIDLITDKTKTTQTTAMLVNSTQMTHDAKEQQLVSSWKEHIKYPSKTPFYLAAGLPVYSGSIIRADLFGKADAIVNETNSDLTQSSTVSKDKTIFEACGNKKDLNDHLNKVKSCDLTVKYKKQGKLPDASVIMAPSYDLVKYGAKRIFHVATPKSSEHKLYKAYFNIIALAIENKCYNIAIPLLGLANFSVEKSFELYKKAYEKHKSNYAQKNIDLKLSLIFTFDENKPDQLEEIAKLAAKYNQTFPGVTEYLPKNYAEILESENAVK